MERQLICEAQNPTLPALASLAAEQLHNSTIHVQGFRFELLQHPTASWTLYSCIRSPDRESHVHPSECLLHKLRLLNRRQQRACPGRRRKGAEHRRRTGVQQSGRVADPVQRRQGSRHIGGVTAVPRRSFTCCAIDTKAGMK